MCVCARACVCVRVLCGSALVLTEIQSHRVSTLLGGGGWCLCERIHIYVLIIMAPIPGPSLLDLSAKVRCKSTGFELVSRQPSGKATVVVAFFGCLKSQQHANCISGLHLLRPLYMLPH